jgi:hypothetical protein
MQACSAALHCSRRLCLCGHEMSAFEQPAQPMSSSFGRILPVVLTSHSSATRAHLSSRPVMQNDVLPSSASSTVLPSWQPASVFWNIGTRTVGLLVCTSLLPSNWPAHSFVRDHAFPTTLQPFRLEKMWRWVVTNERRTKVNS